MNPNYFPSFYFYSSLWLIIVCSFVLEIAQYMYTALCVSQKLSNQVSLYACWLKPNSIIYRVFLVTVSIKQCWSDYTEASLPCGWQLGPVGRLPSGDPVTSWFGAAWVGHWWLWSTAGACWRRWSSGHSGDCWPGKPQSTDQNNACREKSYKMITVIQYYVLMEREFLLKRDTALFKHLSFF